MSILIKGMKMPESCHQCVAGYGGFCFVCSAEEDGVCPDNGRPEWCPLVELLPHGRLIDADKITLTDIDLALCEDYKSLLSLYINKVESAQTIIEAEDG